MASEEFRFDWQAQPEGFLKWLLPTLISSRHHDGLIDQLSAATEKFTDVRLTVQINGVDVDPAAFLTGVEMNMVHYAKAEARRLVDEIGELALLRELLEDVERSAVRQLEQRLAAAGIELPDRDGRYD